MPAALLVRVLFWTWFAAAILAGHFLLLQRLPPFGVQGVLFAITALVLFAYFRTRPVREWVDGLALRALVLLHVTRFVGFYFIALYERGELPRTFAVPAGLGDIVVATMALPVVFAPLTDATRLRAIFIWNVVGFFELMMVMVNAARINLTTPGELKPLTYLPLSLLPTFLVPLLIATHVIIFVRALETKR